MRPGIGPSGGACEIELTVRPYRCAGYGGAVTDGSASDDRIERIVLRYCGGAVAESDHDITIGRAAGGAVDVLSMRMMRDLANDGQVKLIDGVDLAISRNDSDVVGRSCRAHRQ